MGKILAVACGLVACSFAQAQTNVTIYGDVDQYIGYIHSSSGKSVIGLDDGAILRSRLGFRGVEDLGNGYQAKFTLEQGFGANTGALADAPRIFDRQAWVGINTPGVNFVLVARTPSYSLSAAPLTIPSGRRSVRSSTPSVYHRATIMTSRINPRV